MKICVECGTDNADMRLICRNCYSEKFNGGKDEQ